MPRNGHFGAAESACHSVGRVRGCGLGLNRGADFGIKIMVGLCYAEISLENPKRADLAPLVATALADTGSLFLCIPEAVQIQLQLEATSQKTVTTADGETDAR